MEADSLAYPLDQRIKVFPRHCSLLQNEKTKQFRNLRFPDSPWDDWRWQLSNSYTSKAEISELVQLTEDESSALGNSGLPVRITPYYASLLSDSPGQPLRRSVLPSCQEFVHSPEEAVDPLNEDQMSPVPGLVHRYPDRVLFLVTDFCSVCCRYCTRSRMVNKGHLSANRDRWDAAISYIRGNKNIRDVLLSGGDPLTLSDEDISYLLGKIRAIPHVEIIRIGTKVPVVLPQRITENLVNILSQAHPLWMSIHFTHPDEITPEVEIACDKLSRVGIPLGSQTVLLKGINDDVAVMKLLMHRLMMIRVRPYYLYMCDPIIGSRQFRCDVKTGLGIISNLRGFTSGYAVPNFVIDAPGGGGKISLLPESIVEINDKEIVLKNFEGKLFSYPTAV